eukprot:SM000137S00459  [mRNA]  locus=s137:192629:195538:+ [translate_table: standard]
MEGCQEQHRWANGKLRLLYHRPTCRQVASLARSKNVADGHLRDCTQAVLLAAAKVEKPAAADAAAAAGGLTYRPIGIQFNGGNVLVGKTNIYGLWYGQWQKAQQDAIRNFIKELSNTAVGQPTTFHDHSVKKWWQLTSRYQDASGRSATSSFNLAKEAYDRDYSYGKLLTDSDVGNLVNGAIATKIFPLDPNGIYFVWSSGDVFQIDDFGNGPFGQCLTYCGYHTLIGNFDTQFTELQVGFSGLPTACPDVCAPKRIFKNGLDFLVQTTPNGDRALDGLINTIATLLSRTVLDPNFDGWNNGFFPETNDLIEAPDLCQTYGVHYHFVKTGNNSQGQSFYYNLDGADGHKYLGNGLVKNLDDPDCHTYCFCFNSVSLYRASCPSGSFFNFDFLLGGFCDSFSEPTHLGCTLVP